MGAVRAVTRGAVAVCAGSVLLFLLFSAHRRADAVAPLVALHLSALAISIGFRLHALRSLILTPDGWVLVPLIGRPNQMLPIADIYSTDDDVVVLDRLGRTVLLGVGRLGGRDPLRVRTALVLALRRFDEPAAQSTVLASP
jgi:hypothetical protein